jgi:hypothetical protein
LCSPYAQMFTMRLKYATIEPAVIRWVMVP